MVLLDNQKSFQLNHVVMSMGNFDGVHMGHRALIQKVISESKRLELPSLICSFDPHPVEVLNKKREFLKIYTANENIELLEDCGLDYLYIEKFTSSLAQFSAVEFLEKVIFPKFNPKKFIFGYDFKFGSARESGFNQVKSYLKNKKCESEIISPTLYEGTPASSTRIRDLIKEGGVVKANEMLTAPYHFTGQVIEGKKLGSKLGFPTINLKSHVQILLKIGVYLSFIKFNNTFIPCVTNIGYNPTVENDSQMKIETHVLKNFNENMVQKNMRLYFLEYIRNEQKFKNIEELKTQIKKDCEKAIVIWQKSEHNVYK